VNFLASVFLFLIRSTESMKAIAHLRGIRDKAWDKGYSEGQRGTGGWRERAEELMEAASAHEREMSTMVSQVQTSTSEVEGE
jgi:hypothetical protein